MPMGNRHKSAHAVFLFSSLYIQNHSVPAADYGLFPHTGELQAHFNLFSLSWEKSVH